MAKTRMNSAHRSVLKDFAMKKIEDVVDRKPEQKLYKKMVAQTNSALRKKYPEKDMDVLRKYQLTQRDNCVRYVFPSGRIEGFDFQEAREELVEIPYTRGCTSYNSKDIYPMPQEFEAMLDEYNKLKDASEKIISQKRRDCNSLIEYAKYVEDVLEVIKIPKEIEDNLTAKSTALVALSPDVIERIQADFNS